MITQSSEDLQWLPFDHVGICSSPAQKLWSCVSRRGGASTTIKFGGHAMAWPNTSWTIRILNMQRTSKAKIGQRPTDLNRSWAKEKHDRTMALKWTSPLYHISMNTLQGTITCHPAFKKVGKPIGKSSTQKSLFGKGYGFVPRRVSPNTKSFWGGTPPRPTPFPTVVTPPTPSGNSHRCAWSL